MAEMANQSNLRVIFGTMTIGVSGDKAVAIEQIKLFLSRGHSELDTARMYAHGKTEEILGEILSAPMEETGIDVSKLQIASKVNPFQGYNENLTPENVRKQSDEILAALKRDSTDILYLHAPDLSTPIEDTLAAVQELYVAGKFRELGLSNYPAWEVVYIFMYCSSRGWVVPTVYQGMYNAITRDVEKELFAALNKCNMRFNAYNPLGGGMLTGKHVFEEDSKSSGTRFDTSNVMYRSRYWNCEYFSAVSLLQTACAAEGVSLSDASLRWMMHHSMLKPSRGDGVIVGASSVAHLTANLDSCAAGPLPASIVAAFDEAWTITKPVCAKYFRP